MGCLCNKLCGVGTCTITSLINNILWGKSDDYSKIEKRDDIFEDIESESKINKQSIRDEVTTYGAGHLGYVSSTKPEVCYAEQTDKIKTRPRSNRLIDKKDMEDWSNDRMNESNGYWKCSVGNLHSLNQEYCHCLMKWANSNPIGIKR